MNRRIRVAHLDSSVISFLAILSGAGGIRKVDLVALNASGVTGKAILARWMTDHSEDYLNVSLTAAGLTADEARIQHIHGMFDEEGDNANAETPTIALDADGGRFVEVLEGVAA